MGDGITHKGQRVQLQLSFRASVQDALNVWHRVSHREPEPLPPLVPGSEDAGSDLPAECHYARSSLLCRLPRAVLCHLARSMSPSLSFARRPCSALFLSTVDRSIHGYPA